MLKIAHTRRFRIRKKVASPYDSHSLSSVLKRATKRKKSEFRSKPNKIIVTPDKK